MRLSSRESASSASSSQHRVEDGRLVRVCATRLDVGRAAHDHAGEREAAHQTGEQVARRPAPAARGRRATAASSGSSLSVASRLSSVSRLATSAMVTATVHTAAAGSPTTAAGTVSARSPPASVARHLHQVVARAAPVRAQRRTSTKLIARPTATATSGPGSRRQRTSRRVVPRARAAPAPTTEMSTAAGSTRPSSSPKAENVFSWSSWLERRSRPRDRRRSRARAGSA